MASTFQYSPLGDPANEIRLLRIAPDDPPRCQVSIHKLDEAPEYKAISYAWGDETGLGVLLVDEQDFVVRENCWCALWQARLHLPEGTYLWLDAICINQADNGEKSHQVAMMGQIYFQAASVFVSVGEHYDYSGYLYDLAEHFRTRHEMAHDGCPRCHDARISNRWRSVEESELHAYHIWVDNAEDQEYTDLVAAHRAFVNRPYWTRMWIVQETMRAREIEIACGDSVEELQNIVFLSDLLNASYSDSYDLFADKAPARHYEKYLMEWLEDYPMFLSDQRGLHNPSFRSKAFDLSHLLYPIAEFKCADIRDRIYGLLGLVDWGRRGPPKPDYDIDPLMLALQVLERMSDENHRHGGFSFPRDITPLLMALGVNRLNPELSTTRGGSQRKASFCVPSHCNCEDPTAPQISFGQRQIYECRVLDLESMTSEHSSRTPERSSMTSEHSSDDMRSEKSSGSEASTTIEPSTDLESELGRQTNGEKDAATYAWERPQGQRPLDGWDEVRQLLAAYDLRQGDVVLRVAGAPKDAEGDLEGACLCLVLRENHGGYYEILDEAPKVSEQFFRGREALGEFAVRPYRPLRLCLSLMDAASMTLSLDRLIKRAASGDSLNGERHGLLDPDHIRTRMSSYAKEDFGLHERSGRNYWDVMGAPSMDGRSIPCARCGGMFKPSKAMLAEYVQRQSDASSSSEGSESSLDD